MMVKLVTLLQLQDVLTCDSFYLSRLWEKNQKLCGHSCEHAQRVVYDRADMIVLSRVLLRIQLF